MSYSGKVIWITGASSGIGEALAYEFSREGARLILSSNEDEELLRVREACGDMGIEPKALQKEILELDWIGAAAREAAKTHLKPKDK